MQSVRRLAGLPIKVISTYHGGVVDQAVAGQLARVMDRPSA